MNFAPPKPNTVEWPHVKVFVSYTKFYPATLIALIGFNFQPVKTEGEFGYWMYFKERWREGQTFINIEQDIVVWPGAVKALWDCPHDWCAYDFHLPNHQMRNLENEKVGVPIGCVKFSAKLIAETPEMWQEPVAWEYCEQNITKYLVAKGLRVHQHHPGVVNANEVFLDFLGIKED